jgi:hypothetical protein
MREYNSREMPSGFLAADGPVRLSCDGPAEGLGSMESALRMSAAEAFMARKGRSRATFCPMMCQK